MKGDIFKQQIVFILGIEEIKIPFPPDAKKIEDRLRSLGLNKLVDDAILFINRAAENAATEAKPLITQAIKNMTIKDAINIVKGNTWH